MSRKTKETNEKVIKVDVEPVKWKPGDERKPQGYWTEKYLEEYDEIASRLIGAGFTEQNLADTFSVPASAIKGWKRSIPRLLLLKWQKMRIFFVPMTCFAMYLFREVENM